MEKKYSFEKKKKIANKIHLLDVKKHKSELKKIKSIIVNENVNIEFMKNANGLFAHFNNMTETTYAQLEKLLDSIDRNMNSTKYSSIQQNISSNDPEESTIATTMSNSHTETFPKRQNNLSKKLRLTNAETHILNRVRYEKELQKSDSDMATNSGPVKQIDIFSIFKKTTG